MNETLRNNLPIWTSQLKRVDHLKLLPGTSSLYILMTGAVAEWGDSFWPTHVVTWNHRNTAWASLARRTGKREVKVRFYSFDKDDPNFDLKLVNLPHGDYKVTVTPRNGRASDEIKISVKERNQTVSLKLQPECEYDITIKGAE